MGVATANKIGTDWIDFWSTPPRYPAGKDDDILNHVGPWVRERNCYDRQRFLRVGKWKSRRVQGRMARNTDEEIRDITSMAVAAPLPYQHRILTLLHGVAVRMASSLLMAWNPDEHTVIDVRAVTCSSPPWSMAPPSSSRRAALSRSASSPHSWPALASMSVVTMNSPANSWRITGARRTSRRCL